jgi:indole-3-glycerol phosphate synthase
MSDFLQQMSRLSAARATAARRRYTDSELGLPVVPLGLQCFDLIAEIKDSSPSEGALAVAGADRAERARDYAQGGAAAISVLTEPSKFAGELAHLADIVSAVSGLNVPVMRKDFLVDPIQVTEARAAGASGVLLIAAMLSDRSLAAMLDRAYEYSMFVLLEAFDEQDLQRIAKLLEQERHSSKVENRELLIGVNTRNLRTLAVDQGRLARLASLLPSIASCVAESGLASADDAAEASRLGYRMALVGTALMKSTEPAKLMAAMLAAGRRRAAA